MDTAALLEMLWTKLLAWLESLVVMLPNAAVAIVVVLLFGFSSKWIGRGAERILHRATKNVPISELLGTVCRIAVIIVGVLIALGLLNLDKTVTSLLAGVGVIGLALGFAFQDIAANFMSGFIMAINRPIDVGDLVDVGGHKGRVDRVELRATQMTTLDGLSIIIPNKDVFQNPIVNYTKTQGRRVVMHVGVAYHSPLRKVRDMVIEVAKKLPGRNEERDPEAHFVEFGDSSINLTLFVWVHDSNERAFFAARSELIMSVKEKFDEQGITIPFPIRTLDFGADDVGGKRLDDMKVQIEERRAA